ncbi:MAG: hypothetical protein VB085_01005 [Peptococcaceae bacterium]|nr:hypothetical protein [Peptococcaceae bacterium]
MTIRQERYQEICDMFWKETDELGTGIKARNWRSDLTKEEAALVAKWDEEYQKNEEDFPEGGRSSLSN